VTEECVDVYARATAMCFRQVGHVPETTFLLTNQIEECCGGY